MKKLIAITALSVSLGAQAQDEQYDDPCEFWHEAATRVFDMRQNGTPMPDLMKWGSDNDHAAYVVRQAYHPLHGAPGFGEEGKQRATRDFANRIAEQCYREQWP